MPRGISHFTNRCYYSAIEFLSRLRFKIMDRRCKRVQKKAEKAIQKIKRDELSRKSTVH